jgi:hypothetical protein
VLALPSAVDEAARALLLKNGEAPPFLPAAKLAIDVRERSSWKMGSAGQALVIRSTGADGRGCGHHRTPRNGR